MSLGRFRCGGRLWLNWGTNDYELVDTYELLYKFNAQLPHLTEPFLGRRFTITYYSDGRILERNGIDDALKKLSDIGAPVPSKKLLQQWKRQAMTHSEQNAMLEAAKCCSRKYLDSRKQKGNCPMMVCWDCKRRCPLHPCKNLCGICDMFDYDQSRHVKFN
eukprot:8180663-Karenia_brevis.AAC.1